MGIFGYDFETALRPLPMRRRDFLHAALGVATCSLTGCSGCADGPSSPVESAANGGAPEPVSKVDLELALRAAPESVPLLDGPATEVWRFSARVLQGPTDGLAASDVGYLGPTLRVKRGQRVRVQLDNALGEDTIVHWHGLYVSERNDGHPSSAVGPGGRYTYEFDVENRAGTYWYHAHPLDRTGPQVYRGLAGLLLVTDDDEQRLGLPDGDRELVVVLQDRTFDQSNHLLYAPNRMLGFLGERILVNGQLPQIREVPSGPHRLRVLNGSNSRVYDLGWSDGSPLVVLGTDGGLLDVFRERAHVVLAPGQRLDVWANFGTSPGADVWLESRAFDGIGPSGGMMGGGMMGSGAGTGIVNGAPFRIQRFVTTGTSLSARPPDSLVPAPGPTASEVVNLSAPKRFTTQMRMMQWLLNDRSFEIRNVAANERVRLGTVEEWEFVNVASPMAMGHPIHVHGAQFRIVERKQGAGASSLREGIFDEGWQDTFLLLPGDSVRIRVKFDRHTGLFLYHCHNLEHEDMGMMRNYVVES